MVKNTWIAAVALVASLFVTAGAQAQTTLRMAWYSDGNEGEVLLDLLKRFEAKKIGRAHV